MADVEIDPTFQAALDTFIAAEEARRNALERLGFHQLADLIIYHEKQIADLKLMDEMALASMTPEERAAALAARKPNDKDTEEREALEEQEDLFGRRIVLAEEAEAFQRTYLTFAAIDLAFSIDAAFKPCIRKRYDYAWGTTGYTVLPMQAHALDRVERNPDRHIPSFMWQEMRQGQEWFQSILDSEHAEKFGSTLETLSIEPPKSEPKQAPLALDDGAEAPLRISA